MTCDSQGHIYSALSNQWRNSSCKIEEVLGNIIKSDICGARVGLHVREHAHCVFKWNLKIFWCVKGQTKIYSLKRIILCI